MDLSKKGFLLCSNFFSKDEILKIEKLFIQLVACYVKNQSKDLFFKLSQILKLSGEVLRLEIIKFLENIENNDGKLFYEICYNFQSSYLFNSFIFNNKKLNKLLKQYFSIDYLNIKFKSPLMIFNKKNLKRLQYEWHQESQFYPQYKMGLHLWFPLFRHVNNLNDGGMQFALNSHYKNYPYIELKNKNGWTQRIPKINNIEKKFKILQVGARRGDAIIFVNGLLHKSDVQLNDIPRIAFVTRFLSAYKKQNLSSIRRK